MYERQGKRLSLSNLERSPRLKLEYEIRKGGMAVIFINFSKYILLPCFFVSNDFLKKVVPLKKNVFTNWEH